MSRLPLEGVRVLDITVVWAGPYASQLLADWGAEVIRVESLQIVPYFTRVTTLENKRADRGQWWITYPNWEPGSSPWNRFGLFNVHARNKLSMAVDLTRPEGMDVFRELLQVSDVFLENNAPGLLERLGLDYPNLRKIREDIIQVRMPGFGLTGPYRHYRMYGNHAEALVSHNWLKGYDDSDPSGMCGTTLGDALSGITAAFATVAALRHRRRTGKGQLIEVAQAECIACFLPKALMDYSMNRRNRRTLGNHHTSMAPHNVYPCKGDDQWVALCVASDQQWQALVKAMDSTDWAKDKRYCTVLGRYRHQRELDEKLAQWTLQHTHREIMEMLQPLGIAAGPVMDDKDTFEDPHLKERGFFQELEQADTGRHLHAGPMWKMGRHPNRLRLPPCRLGEHNEYVYRELLGFSEAVYRRLEREGHIGTRYQGIAEQTAVPVGPARKLQ